MPRACRYCVRCTKSSGASRTWPASEPVRLEPVLPQAHEPVLADGGDGLEHGGVGRALRRPSRPSAAQPAAMAPERDDDDGVAVGARAAAISRHRRCHGLRASTDDEPTLTTAITRTHLTGPRPR